MSKQYRPPTFSRDWWCAVFVGVSMTCGFVSIFWRSANGGFLPSDAWHSLGAQVALGWACLTGIGTFILANSDADPFKIGRRPLVQLLWNTIGTAFLAYVGFLGAFMTPAMVSIWVSSQWTEAEYQVSNPHGSSSRLCGKRVDLGDRPYLQDMLCGVPDVLRDRLEIGSRLVVGGPTNWFGLVPATIWPAEDY